MDQLRTYGEEKSRSRELTRDSRYTGGWAGNTADITPQHSNRRRAHSDRRAEPYEAPYLDVTVFV